MLDTLDNVKSRLAITESTHDAFIAQQINLISDVIEAYCRRSFTIKNYTQSFFRGDYRFTPLLELFHFPLISVTSVIEDGVTLDPTFYRVHKPTGRIIRPNTSSVNSVNRGLFFIADETVVTYSSGFSSIPSPILAVLDNITMERYNKRSSGVELNFGSDVQRVSIPGALSIDFDYSLKNNDRDSNFGVFLGNNLNVLDYYRSDRAILGNGKLAYVEEV